MLNYYSCNPQLIRWMRILGRAAIISNGSPLFSGNTASGESQIRRWMLENDLIEAIIQMPTDLFYNTGISTYIWLLSKNKRPERKGKIQLIDASSICHKLRKPLGNKKNEFLPKDRAEITKLYANFEENELVKIFDNTEFIYKEYTVMQPLQRSYSITKESIERMLRKGALNGIYDEAKVYELENPTIKEESSNKRKTKSLEQIKKKEIEEQKKREKNKKQLANYYKNKPIYDAILRKLKENISNNIFMSINEFMPVLTNILSEIDLDNKTINKIADGLSVMNKNAMIQREIKGKKKGEIIYDKESKDIELVRWDTDIEDYMKKEVLPHIPDAKWFWEEDMTKAKPVIKTGAEIPFTRYFYKYQPPKPSNELATKFIELEKSVSERINKLFGGM
ncbi:N-6 DNA methylase [Clostridium sp. C1]|uniref:HsdM family class I SAM-dependent methyltransferase n=1 Tax=Clostridium sp. C1 TaxID=1155388 RepID=UPI0024B259DB|nr:N-6 DNA methylase [Clostridium sp. C1]